MTATSVGIENILPARKQGTVGGSGRVSSNGTDLPSGHGLAGLRERAERLAGRLEAGAGPGGGFRLRVSVPIEPGRVTA